MLGRSVSKQVCFEHTAQLEIIRFKLSYVFLLSPNRL